AAAVIVVRGNGPHPRIVAFYPANGDRYFPGGNVEIEFSHPMNQSSVQRGLQVSPGGEGQAAWYGNTLNLQPVGDWTPNVTYRIKLIGKVTDDLGRPLKTPVSFWFHVFHVGRIVYCDVNSIRNICTPAGKTLHPLTHSPTPVLQYALSSDGSMLAFIRRGGRSAASGRSGAGEKPAANRSSLPHLFVEQVDGSGLKQLTFGNAYADSDPSWVIGDDTDVTYHRRPVEPTGKLGKAQVWNVNVDGSANARLSG
ncbi:MAG TPA: Ig-like domain-containing protein, partial [Chloroflexota bacterium]|nr:Ig-like domain-containing protein [Chloroflexota bacterium]